MQLSAATSQHYCGESPNVSPLPFRILFANRQWSSEWKLTPLATAFILLQITVGVVLTIVLGGFTEVPSALVFGAMLVALLSQVHEFRFSEDMAFTFDIPIAFGAIALLLPNPEQLAQFLLLGSLLIVLLPGPSIVAGASNAVQTLMERSIAAILMLALYQAHVPISILLTAGILLGFVVNLVMSELFDWFTNEPRKFSTWLFREGGIVSFSLQTAVEIAVAQIGVAVFATSPWTMVWFFAPLGLLHFVNRQQLRLVDAENASRTDELTQLRNRRGFDADAANFLVLNRSNPERIGLAVFDLDNFKLLNDTKGHATGDIALRRFGLVLDCLERLSPDNSWVVARVGGEEFVALFEHSNHPNMLETIRSNTELELAEFDVTVSTGWIRLDTIAAETRAISNESELLQLMMSNADAALYKAKNSGRNAVVSSDEPVSLRRAA